MTTTVVPGLLEQLRRMPDDAFTRLQYLAPQVGCFNGCAMCSQGAGRDIWSLTQEGLTGLFTALAGVAAERSLAIASGRIHRPGVVFPYLDNDIGSYPHLDHYAQLARDVLGVKLRISTVGYSRHSARLAAMHQHLVKEFTGAFDGIRFSVTPYTLGFTGRFGVDRQAYIEDLAAALRTYRPLLDVLGHGATTAACELRFAPLVGIGELTDARIDGHHVLATGPHLLISHERTDGELPETVIESLDEPLYSEPGAPYLHITSDIAPPTAATVQAALTGTLSVPHRARTVRLHRFSNADGPYFAADPNFHPDGTFTTLHLYPATAVRPNSGYTDATRPLLNTLLAHKRAHGLGRRDEFAHATGADVATVLQALTAQADELQPIDRAAAAHLCEQIHPQVTAYAAALERARLPTAHVLLPDLHHRHRTDRQPGPRRETVPRPDRHQRRTNDPARGTRLRPGQPVRPPRTDLADGTSASCAYRAPATRRHREEEPSHQRPEPTGRGTRPLPSLPRYAHHWPPPAPPHAGPAGRLDRAHQHGAGPDSLCPARPARGTASHRMTVVPKRSEEPATSPSFPQVFHRRGRALSETQAIRTNVLFHAHPAPRRARRPRRPRR
ncbi:hypothetical protein ACFQ10_32210 [Streptomyces indonesiensis]